MESQTKSRTDTAVPAPQEAKKMSEPEKRALELGDEIEHAHGEERDRLAGEAEELQEKGDAASKG